MLVSISSNAQTNVYNFILWYLQAGNCGVAKFAMKCAKQLNALEHVIFWQWVPFLNEMNKVIAFWSNWHKLEREFECVSTWAALWKTARIVHGNRGGSQVFQNLWS